MTDLELIERVASKRAMEESEIRRKEAAQQKKLEEKISTCLRKLSKMLELCQSIHEHHLEDLFTPQINKEGMFKYGIAVNALYSDDEYAFIISSGTYYLCSDGKKVVKRHFGRDESFNRLIMADIDLMVKLIEAYEPTFYNRFHIVFGSQNG